MTRDADDPMEAEFDTVAEWTAEVAAELGRVLATDPDRLDRLAAGLRALAARPGGATPQAGSDSSQGRAMRSP